MALSFTSVPSDPALLDLPWHIPLADWPDEQLVTLPRGISRHVVRFVQISGRVYAIKEVELRVAEREFRLLRALERMNEPAVEAVGIVDGREDAQGQQLDRALITRHLQFSLPYRAVFSGQLRSQTAARLLDALAVLLVRLHLAGFFWGDCSLSNTLFRRDAGAFAAYLVDAETGELHQSLSKGQRGYDLEIAQINITGELLDLREGGLLDELIDPYGTSEAVIVRYQRLWSDLLDPQTYKTGERYKVEDRLRRLNDLGFDVEELKIIREADGNRVVVQPKVVDAGHHSRRLFQLTGLEAMENQARRLLNDLDTYRAAMSIDDEQIGASRWLMEVFEPVVRAVPRDLHGKLEAAELFHELLEHRWYLSEAAGHDVGLWEAVPDYVAGVLPTKPDEQAVLGSGLGDASTVRLPSPYSSADATVDARELSEDTGQLPAFSDEALENYKRTRQAIRERRTGRVEPGK